MTTAPAIPASSIPSAGPAPSAVSPQMAPVSPAQPSYQTAPAGYIPEAPVSAPQANPWQAAYQGLLASLNGTPSSQPQAYSSPMTQQVAPSPAAYQSPAVSYQTAPSVSAPLTSAYPQMPAYSPSMAPAYSPQAAPSQNRGGDEYLQSVSDESLEVLQHFGSEAPALLNRYACVVEDALLAQAEYTAQAMQQLQQIQGQLQNSHAVIQAAAEDNAAYKVLLTDPDMLAGYVNDFYGPSGPYPVETSQDRLAAEVAASERFYAPQAPAYQRPQLDMPDPTVQAGAPGSDFWSVFSQVSERNPAMAWQVLSQATPEALRSKVLVSEG